MAVSLIGLASQEELHKSLTFCGRLLQLHQPEQSPLVSAAFMLPLSLLASPGSSVPHTTPAEVPSLAYWLSDMVLPFMAQCLLAGNAWHALDISRAAIALCVLASQLNTITFRSCDIDLPPTTFLSTSLPPSPSAQSGLSHSGFYTAFPPALLSRSTTQSASAAQHATSTCFQETCMASTRESYSARVT